MELLARYFYRGHKLEFSSDIFFECTITSPNGLEVGGVRAAAATTTPVAFLEDCKAAVNRLLVPPTPYKYGTNEKKRIDGGRR